MKWTNIIKRDIQAFARLMSQAETHAVTAGRKIAAREEAAAEAEKKKRVS